MLLHQLPDDVLADIMEWGHLYTLSRTCKHFHLLWHSIFVRVSEDANGFPLLRQCMTPAMASGVRSFHYTGERISWHPLMNFMRPRTVILHITNWFERWNICKLMTWFRPHVERLVLRSAGSTAPHHLLTALCTQLKQAETLRFLEVCIRQGHVTDTLFQELGHTFGQMKQLRSLCLSVPMNSITVAGLQRFMDGVASLTTLREVGLDISGNWIRGTQYGKQLSRLVDLHSLRRLHLTFGGWGVRKQFGLEYLMLLGSHSCLQSLSITIIGARITCESFKKAMQGIAVLPQLRELNLDLRSCDVGDQCHRGLALLRSAKRLERVSLGLGHPSERLLSVVGAIQHTPNLKEFTVAIDQRGQVFGVVHANRLATFSHPFCVVRVTVHNANLINPETVRTVLNGGFPSVKTLYVCIFEYSHHAERILVCRNGI